MEDCFYHTPVLLGPSVDGLQIREDGIYIDVTLGGGGHSWEILKRLGPKGHLFSFDQDADAYDNWNAHRAPLAASVMQGQWTFIRSNFRYLRNWMRYYGITAIDGVLADLGVSSHHFDASERGFSFRSEAPLDMRMNRQARMTAADVVNTYSESQLTNIFRLYGELRQAPRLSAALVKTRLSQPIQTTAHLAETLAPLLGRDRERKDLARVFQALRIEVNHEMDALRDMLVAASELLRPGGRLVVLSYHSLEDRMVKNIIRTGNVEGLLHQDFYGRSDAPMIAIGKPIVPGIEEQKSNPRSRSAKLRIGEKR